ncbi:phage major tail tube protein [Phreatobacter sp. HK31-P]
MLDNILRDFTVFLDGVGKLGDAETVKLPALMKKTDEYRGGGMEFPVEIDLGMEKLEAEITLSQWDPQVYSLFGMHSNIEGTPLTFRGHVISSTGTAKSCIVHMRGFIKGIAQDTIAPGKKNEKVFTFALSYYKHVLDDQVLIELAARDMIHVVGGQDLASAKRSSLGL